MRRFSIATDLSAASRLSLGLFMLIFGLPVIFRPARAQEKADPVSSSCVPSDLVALVFSERHAVRVSEFKEGSGRKDGAKSEAASSDAFRAPQDARQKKEMYSVLLKQARQGNAAAMVNVGLFSLAGWGTQPNAGAGLYWLHEAGDRGNNAAFYALGILYLEGCGVRQDEAQAFHFFRLGAAGGNPAAQVNLGYLYDHGLGTTQDHGTAAYWYRQAAEAGEAHAEFNLADQYLHGEGVPVDEAAAFGWFQKAAFQGHTEAQIMVGSMLYAGRGTSKDLRAAYLWIFAALLEGDERGAPTLRALESQLTRVEIEQAKVRAQSFLATHKLASDVALLP